MGSRGPRRAYSTPSNPPRSPGLSILARVQDGRGVRVETVEAPPMQQIRYLDKSVDELAKGRPREKVLRT